MRLTSYVIFRLLCPANLIPRRNISEGNQSTRVSFLVRGLEGRAPERAYKYLMFPRWSSLERFPFRYRLLALPGIM
jgi:hypothetical protein